MQAGKDRIPGGFQASFHFPFRITWYVAREFLLSFLISFFFFFVVFFINQILLLAEDILAKNAPLGQTMLLLLYSLPSIIAISFPFASLAGALMASARLNADNEMLAFSASGISIRALYVPFIAVGLMAALISFAANDYFLPRGTVAFQKVYRELVAQSSSMELTPFSVKQYSKATVVTGEQKGQSAGDVLLFETGDRQDEKVISAGKANIVILPGENDALITMENVLELQMDSPGSRKFSVSKAETVNYKFVLREPIVGFSSTGPSEMSSQELLQKIESKKKALDLRILETRRQQADARAKLLDNYSLSLLAPPVPPAREEREEGDRQLRKLVSAHQLSGAARPSDRSLQIYELEYNKKFAIPAAGFFFALLAFPLGLGTKKAGRTAGFGLALLLSVLYWGLLFAGQTLGLRSSIDPALAIWAPNALVALATGILWLVRHFSARRIA